MTTDTCDECGVQYPEQAPSLEGAFHEDHCSLHSMAIVMSKKSKTDWTLTPQGSKAYEAARAKAQAKANETGYDHGIERNDLFKEFHVFMLPQRHNRCGHELTCEVVMCENLDRCQPGHGPNRA